MRNQFSWNWITVLGFGVVFALISLVNHYQLRTAALDLGMFNHAIYSYAHFDQAVFTSGLKGHEVNYLGDHFSPITALLSPFYYLFGSYTLLILQIAFVLIGGLGIFRYAKQYHRNPAIATLVMAQFFAIWGIYSALSFDFHTNVIAAMMLPWLVVFHHEKKTKSFLLVFVLMLLCKENMALWLIFILLGLSLKDGLAHWRQKFKLEVPLMLFCVLYFFVIVGSVMPYLNEGLGTNQLARYGALGGSLTEILSSCLHHPIDALALLFENSSGETLYDGIKAELHWMVLASGGIALIYRPWLLIMLVPIYGQKMLSSDYAFWGINGQYSIEFVPVLSLALVHLLTAFSSYKWKKGAAITALVITAGATLLTMQSRTSKWYDKNNTAFYHPDHYDAKLDVSTIMSALESIPEDAKVSCLTYLAPHLAFREKIYHFPVVKDAEYVALLLKERSTYPLSREDYDKEITRLRTGDFDVFYESEELLILKRK